MTQATVRALRKGIHLFDVDEIIHVAEPERMAFVNEVAKVASDDPHTQTAIVGFHPNGFVGLWGANRFAPGVAYRAERLERPAKYQWLLHAEADMLARTHRWRYNERISQLDFYMNWFPCASCASLLAAAGVHRLTAIKWARPVSSDAAYVFDAAEAILREAGVHVTLLEPPEDQR